MSQCVVHEFTAVVPDKEGPECPLSCWFWLHMKHVVERGRVVFPDLVDSMKCCCWFMKC